MRTRIIVGATLGVAAVVLIWLGGPWFFAAILALGLVGLSEFYRITGRYRPITLAGFVALIAALFSAWHGSPELVLGSLGLALLLAFGLGLIGGPKPDVTTRIGATVLGVVYVGLGFAALLLLRGSDNGLALVLTVVFGTWASDTVAYFSGRFFGQTPMTPRLSPKKTWEGFAGGVIGTLVLVEFIGLYTFLSPLQSLELGAIIALVAPVGDLFESLIKRDAEIKDAGSFFPGHGGILDRFDALLFVSVAAYVFATQVLGVA
jgi:phosphatidate cytidylyltransferase